MVYRKKSFRSFRKPMAARKTIVKRKRYVRKRNYIPKHPRTIAISSAAIAPFGRKLVRKLAYTETLTLNPGLGGIAQYVYSCNSLYDPNVTGAGHQPRGFDQIMAAFNFYTVIGSRIRARVVGSELSGATRLLLTNSNTTTPVSMEAADSYAYIKENQHVKDQMIIPGNAQLNANRKISLNHGWSAKKFFNAKNLFDGTQWRGTSATSPTEQAYWNVIATGWEGADVGACYVEIDIEYIAVFEDPIAVASS